MARSPLRSSSNGAPIPSEVDKRGSSCLSPMSWLDLLPSASSHLLGSCSSSPCLVMNAVSYPKQNKKREKRQPFSSSTHLVPGKHHLFCCMCQSECANFGSLHKMFCGTWVQSKQPAYPDLQRIHVSFSDWWFMSESVIYWASAQVIDMCDLSVHEYEKYACPCKSNSSHLAW